MLKITRTTLLEGFHDSPFLWVPINWSNIALIWSEADILGPGCQSEIKASDITTCPKIPPNSGADDSKPIRTFLSHLSALKRNNFTFIKCEKCSGRCDLAVEAGQSRCYCWSSPLLIIVHSHDTNISPQKMVQKGKYERPQLGKSWSGPLLSRTLVGRFPAGWVCHVDHSRPVKTTFLLLL